jgi:hypothetical protein
VAETFRRRKDGEEWALEMERNIDRHASSNPRALGTVRTLEGRGRELPRGETARRLTASSFY